MVPSLSLAIGFTIANMIESMLAAWLLLRSSRALSFVDLTGVRHFTVACGIAAAASATLATVTTADYSLSFVLSWFCTDLLGMLIVTPIITIAMQRNGIAGRRNAPPWPEVLYVVGLTAAVSVGVFAQSSYPMLFLPMAAVLVAVVRLGTLGAAAGLFTVAMASSVSIVFGHGPTALLEPGPERIFFIQFYLLVLLATTMPISALLTTLDRLLDELKRSNRLLTEARREAERVASRATGAAETDELTGLPNRRKAIALLHAAVSENQIEPLSIAMFDVDHFKRVNDLYGHPVGDKVLRRVASDAAAALRGADFIARFGGEEFILILPGAAADHALAAAERVRAAVAAGGAGDGTDPSVTVSLGLAQWASGDTPETLLSRADVALYDAKAAGRDTLRLAA